MMLASAQAKGDGEARPAARDGFPGRPMATAEARGSAKSVFADLSGWRKVDVSGHGVLAWLGQLIDADVSDLAPGRAHRATLRDNATTTFTVSAAGGSLLLLQDPEAPPVATLLAAPAATAGMTLEDRSTQLALFAFPHRSMPPDVAGTAFCAPSCLGTGGGVDVLALADDHTRLLAAFRRRFVELADDQVAALRRGD